MAEGSLAHFIHNDASIEAPPNIDHRNFNINDILGDVDFDEIGNMVP